jgi:tetratricopeptide (TPR) repeat protein
VEIANVEARVEADWNNNMRTWFVAILVVVVVTALILGGSLQVILSLLNEEQRQSILPFALAIGVTVLIANGIIAVMQWFQMSPLDFLPERTLKDRLRKQDRARFSLTKSKDVKLLSEQAKAAKNQDQYDWVSVFAESWIQLKPSEADAYELLGEALIKLNKNQDAITIGEKLTTIEPLNFRGFGLLGDAYLELGEREQSRVNYERASQLVPSSHRQFILIDLAKVYGLLGHADEAVKTLEELIPLLDGHSREYYQKQLDHMKQIVDRSQLS